MQIIYIDTLFLLNATVDYLLLLASARVAGEPLARFRFLLGAIIGGLYAVGIFVFPFLQSLYFKCTLALLIILVAFGKSHRLLRQGLIFLSLSFAFAGGILAISLSGGQDLALQGGVLYTSMDLKMVLLSASGCYGLLTLLFQNFGKHSAMSGELVSITLILDDKEISFTALIDTGNTLQDPVSGTPVLVAEGRTLAPFFPPDFLSQNLSHPTALLSHYETTEISTRLRLIPYQAVGVQGLLLVIKVDEILVQNNPSPHTLVALSPTSVCDGGSYKALIGAVNAY